MITSITLSFYLRCYQKQRMTWFRIIRSSRFRRWASLFVHGASMNAPRKRRFRFKQLIILNVIALFVYYFVWPALTYNGNRDVEYGHRLAQYLKKHQNFTYESSQKCRFPLLDPMDPSIRKFIKHPDALKCNKVHPNFVTARFNRLYINPGLASEHKLEDLQFSLFRRPNGSDAAVLYDPFRPFTETITMNGASGAVLRGKYGDNKAYVDIFSSVNPIFPKIKKTENVPDRPNVLILGIDSVSRSNVVRNLPKSYHYLMTSIGGFDFHGYSKIDDNTSPNMIALLTGRKVTVRTSELPLDSQKEFIDDYPFIWKNFSKNGYVTMLAEEQPGIFSYKAMGFKRAPVDVYLRPFGHILNDNPVYRSLSPFCYGNKPEAEHVLDAIERFMETQSASQLPFFVFSFLWKLSHDEINMVERLDELFYKWLKRIHEKGLLRDTLLVVMSDHGNRFDEIRSTLIGRIEERMPFLFIRPPEKIMEMYPDIKETLNQNLYKLSCQYDVYETLMDIIQNKIGQSRQTFKDRGKSLFTPLPLDRSCGDLDIDEHFCVCQEEKKLEKEGKLVLKTADFVIKRINEELEEVKQLCIRVKLDQILEATKLESNKKVQNNNRWHFNTFIGDSNMTESVSYIRLTFKAQPNAAIFEATVQVKEYPGKPISVENFKIGLDQISRINAYGQAASCVAEKFRRLEKICTCGETPA